MPFAWVGAATSILGAVNGAEGQQESTNKSNSMDPRMDKYVYGADGTGGLLGDASNWYQSNKSGMNDQMRQGLNQQWQTFNDPATMAGYRQMSNLGSGLLGGPVMGNPFSDGRVSLMNGRGMGLMGRGGSGSNLGLGGATFGGSPPTQGQYPSYQPVYSTPSTAVTANSGPFAAPPPPPPAPPAPAPAPGAAPPGFTNAPADQLVMDASGNMYRIGPDGRPVSLYGDSYAGGA